MNFIGAVGKLMAGTGLKELLESTFGSVDKMLKGIMYPQNIRALRFVVEELLRPILPETNSYKMAKKSYTANVWVDVLIKPVFIIHLYLRAEKEGKWALHLEAVSMMIPYFFAAGHHNYARCAKTIVNIASGKVTPEAHTNIYDCLQISNAQYAEFEASLPQGFHDPILKKVILAGTKTKRIKSADGKREAQDMGAIFNRLLLFNQVSDVKIDMKTVLGFELTPLPLSMFEPDGKIRLCKNKSDLKNTLKKEIPSRTAKAPDFVIIDGCAILWIIHWPTSGTLSSYVKGFLKYVLDKVSQNDTALIFDRYNEYSIKSV